VTEQFISWRLDAAGAANAARTYRGTIADVLAAASASFDPAAAKHLLATAARDHSSGKYGARERHSLKPPPDAMRTFIKPSVKATPKLFGSVHDPRGRRT
jgi:hypothetical protein